MKLYENITTSFPFPIHREMASEDAIIAQRLECSLCFELMQEPKLLSCTHTFCKDCLAKLYQCQRKTDQISCPVCRQTTRLQNGNVSRLQTNVPIKAMIGDVQSAKRNCTVCNPETKSIATAYCQTCVEYMCDSCLEPHNKFRKHKDHEVFSVDDINKGKVKVKRFCHDHPQEEKLWVCVTCNCLICFRCRVLQQSDSNHKLETVTDFKKLMKDQIESLTRKAGVKVKSFERHMKITKEQDAKIELKIDGIIADIAKAYNESIQQLTKRRNILKEQCHELKNKLKMQLSDINRVSKNELDCITSASDLVSNGMKTILEGETLAVHTTLCNELEDMLGKDGPDDSKPTAITKQAEDVEFTRYRGEKELDLGHVKRKTMWELKKVYEYPLSRTDPWDVHPTLDGGAAVGYGKGGGIELFTHNGPQKAVLKESGIVRFCMMSNGRYVVLDSNIVIKLYTPDWKLLPVKFNTHLYNANKGLCVDKYDNIFVGNGKNKITVFGPEGGAPIREIHCQGCEPIYMYIQHMHHSKLLVVNNGAHVRVIDENGTVKCDINIDGYRAWFTVLRDDNILIGWIKCQELTINLYTPELICIRTVLHTFKGNFSTPCCLTELTREEIACTDHNNLYVFRKFEPSKS